MLDQKLTLLAIRAKNIVNFDFKNVRSPGRSSSPADASSSTDRESWRGLRTKAQELVQQYLDNPANTDLLAQSQDFVNAFESIDDHTESAEYRAKVNIVNLTGRMHRSHYTSYIAGKYSVDDHMPPTFKIWLHNASANSSMDLMDCMESLEHQMQLNKESLPEELKQTRSLLRLFAQGAAQDASRFLDLADRFADGKSQCLTKFNQARLAAYRNYADVASDRIDQIEFPQKDGHPALLQWHLDNLSSYNRDEKLQTILSKERRQKEVLNKLTMCAKHAGKYVEDRGGRDKMWSEEDLLQESKRNFRRGKVVIAACGVGAIVSTLLLNEGQIAEPVMRFLEALVESLELIPEVEATELLEVPEDSQRVLAEGDWAARRASGVLGATFGDGDWA